MGRSQETFNKKEVRNKKEKKRKEKEQKRLSRKESGDNKNNMDDMIAYVDENGVISSTPPDPDKKKEEIDPDEIAISVPKRSEEEEDPVRKGTVNSYFDAKGYGFIRDTETKESLFFHVNNVLEDVKEGNLVSFEVEMGHKGPVAVKVKPIK
ncbi:MAG: cold shock domain-containing protein [Marinilabilia sp.]